MRLTEKTNNALFLTDADRQILLNIFSGIDHSFDVWAYGSRVNGNAHEGSDLDLAIRSKDLEPLPATLLSKLKAKIADSAIPILVDICDWAVLPESFQKNIARQHIVLYRGAE